MTEQEWLKYRILDVKVLNFLNERATERQRRLFACACCRRIWLLLTAPELRQAVEAAERLADGLLTENEIDFHRAVLDRIADTDQYCLFHACAVKWAVDPHVNGVTAAQYAKEALAYSASREPWSKKYAKTMSKETPHQMTLLRDILGNPFRPVTANSDWRTSTVVSLATGIYDERAFDRLPILADALEDAGCTDADILNHCRQPGEHVRGCWAVDLVLQKK